MYGLGCCLGHMYRVGEGAQGDGEPGALEEVMISDTTAFDASPS